MDTIKTTCPYCGVGCGISAQADAATRQVKISGDMSHPANFGRLCAKGLALGETLELQGRLLSPLCHGQQSTWEAALNLVADTFNQTIAEYGADSVAIYGSGQLLTEDYYVANKLMKGFIGSGNMDTNSRLCMSSSVAGHKRAFGSDTVPGCYEDFELAGLVILIGSNAAWCHPVIFQRLRAAKLANSDLKIVVIDPRRTASCDIADLHLAIASSSDALLFNGLLQYLHDHDAVNSRYIQDHTEGYTQALPDIGHDYLSQAAQLCGLPPQQLETFYQWFAETDNTMSLYSQGINQSTSGTDKVNAIINCHLATGRIGRPGMGPFSLTGQPNAMGGREVGGLSHQLAAHMDFSNPEDVGRVARFWQTENIAQKQGYPAVELFDAMAEGKIKAVWIMGTNPVVSLPNADKVKQALQNCPFVVVSDCIAETDTTALAHVLLPAQGWSEKDGTVTNSERRISRQRPLLPPSGEAKPDWWIICQVARRMGFAQAFAYENPGQIFQEHAALSGFENDGQRDFDISGLAGLSPDGYAQLTPTQWPVNARHPQGTARLFANGQFFTASAKAQFVPVTPQTPANLPDGAFPLVLNTGRTRDQWHTMTRTAIAPVLNRHKPEPYVEIHPDDAARHHLQANGLATLTSHWGRMVARVRIDAGQKPGNIFVPMHWSGQYASQGRMGALVNPCVDPVSKQPESKHTPADICPYQPAWQGFVLTRQPLAKIPADYWVKIKHQDYFQYELAGNNLAETWQTLARSDFSGASGSVQWLHYEDAAAGHFRAAAIVCGQLRYVVSLAPDQGLPPRHWLGHVFAQTKITAAERKALLSGIAPPDTDDAGEVVCVCFNVGANTIKAAIRGQGLKTPQEVGRCLQAGTGCGSCLPEIRAMLPLSS
ncbi:MAG: nitrate reductase [Methylovulum sp.]|nr:nitrate reductase [Methylovulum sp.]